jgi:predicted kinase
MSKPIVIIIAGPSGTGKTTLGKHLARRYNLPFIHKDGIKEILLDALECDSLEFSRRLSFSSMLLLYYFAEALVSARQSVIVEANFRPDLATREWLELKDKRDFEPFQIQCYTEGKVLLQRLRDRTETGERHPRHHDRAYLENAESELLTGRQKNLEIGGQVYKLDTTDLERIDYEGLHVAIETTVRLVPQVTTKKE